MAEESDSTHNGGFRAVATSQRIAPTGEALLVETWNQLTVGFAEPSEENPGRHRPIALEVEQDTLDEMAMVEHSKADQAKPSTAEADFKPIESEVLSGQMSNRT